MSSIAVAIRKIPNSVEVVVVMVIAFGYLIYESVRWLVMSIGDREFEYWKYWSVKGSRAGYQAELDAIAEIIILSLTFILLRTRGWTRRDLNLQANVQSIWHSMVFTAAVLGIHLTYFQMDTIFELIYPDHFNDYQTWEQISFYTWIPAIIIDAFYNEFFLLCYLFRRLERWSPFAIVGLSTVLRLSYWVHMGPHQYISVVLIGVLTGWYYWKFRNLTVPVVFHFLWNFFMFYRVFPPL